VGVARYDSIADFYVHGWSDHYDDPASSALLSVLGPVEGLRVLDVACGHGRYTREIARRGGTVVGLDISRALIERAVAIENKEPLGARYVCDDLALSRKFDARSFDLVTCGFGLSDVDDLDESLANIARVLAPGGRFAFSILHPAFPGAADVSGSWPPEGSYYQEQRWYADGEASTLRQRVGANHRMISTYVNELVEHGLSVDCMEEPGPAGDWAAGKPEAARFPLYLAIGATRS